MDLSIFIEFFLVNLLSACHGHSETTNAHSFLLENSVNETFDCILKQDVSNVTYLRITLCSSARIKYKAMATELLHLSFEASNFLNAINLSNKD